MCLHNQAKEKKHFILLVSLITTACMHHVLEIQIHDLYMHTEYHQ